MTQSAPDSAILIADGDPDRFDATRAAPVAVRAKLLALYALNLELARAPFAAAEPLLAEMRLQWWIDRLADGGGAQPVLDDLRRHWPQGVPRMALAAQARRREAERCPIDAADLPGWIDATAGAVMATAVEGLGGDGGLAQVAAAARGQGLASWLSALPQLNAHGVGLTHPSPGKVADLAQQGLEALRKGAQARLSSPADAALFTCFPAAARLRAIQRDPARALAEGAPMSEFSRRLALARLALTGGWSTGGRGRAARSGQRR